jgi:hypothetical protein
VQYLRLNVSQFADNSSTHRLARVKEMPTPVNVTGAMGSEGWMRVSRCCAGILNILGDTEDVEYPIYRDGAAPDSDGFCFLCSFVLLSFISATLVTALFDLNNAILSVYPYQNPKLYPQPLLTIPITQAGQTDGAH